MRFSAAPARPSEANGTAGSWGCSGEGTSTGAGVAVRGTPGLLKVGIAAKSLGIGTIPLGTGAKPFGTGAKPLGIGAKALGIGAKALEMGAKALETGAKPTGTGGKPFGIGLGRAHGIAELARQLLQEGQAASSVSPWFLGGEGIPWDKNHFPETLPGSQARIMDLGSRDLGLRGAQSPSGGLEGTWTCIGNQWLEGAEALLPPITSEAGFYPSIPNNIRNSNEIPWLHWKPQQTPVAAAPGLLSPFQPASVHPCAWRGIGISQAPSSSSPAANPLPTARFGKGKRGKPKLCTLIKAAEKEPRSVGEGGRGGGASQGISGLGPAPHWSCEGVPSSPSPPGPLLLPPCPLGAAPRQG